MLQLREQNSRRSPSVSGVEAWKWTNLGPGFYIATWDEIKGALSADHYDAKREIAIAGIEGRFRERFVKPANAIQDLDVTDASGYAEGRGFSILAIDCLLLEALHGHEKGKRTEVSAETRDVFARTLENKQQFGGAFDEDGRAAKFASSVRNGVLHDGETRHGWLVRQGFGDTRVAWTEGERFVLNRDAFHKAVKDCLDEYFARLRRRDDPTSTELRETFFERVEDLCRDSKPKTAP